MEQISKGRAMFEAFWRVGLSTFLISLFTLVQGAQNVADLAGIAWWKAAIASALSAALAAILRLLAPQPVDKAGVGVAGVPPAPTARR